MVKQKCLACGEESLKKAKLSGINATLQHYREQECVLTWRVISDISVRVCLECGNISFSVEKPRLFQEDESSLISHFISASKIIAQSIKRLVLIAPAFLML